MKDCQYVVRPADQPARTYDTIQDAARALLDAGSIEPVSVVTHGSAGQRERQLTADELQRLGRAVRAVRERSSTTSGLGLARLAQALSNLPPAEAV